MNEEAHRTSISLNPQLYEAAQPRIAARFCKNFSKYVEDLIREDVRRSRAEAKFTSPALKTARQAVRLAEADLLLSQPEDKPLTRKKRDRRQG